MNPAPYPVTTSFKGEHDTPYHKRYAIATMSMRKRMNPNPGVWANNHAPGRYMRTRNAGKDRAKLIRQFTQTKDMGAFHQLWRVMPDLFPAASDEIEHLNDSGRFTMSNASVLAWVNEHWWVNSTQRLEHYLHVSMKDRTKVAYATHYENLAKGNYLATTPGRYLTKWFSNVLSEADIRAWATRQVALHTDRTVHFARSASECARVINDGPNSCMAKSFYSGNDSWYRGMCHPGRAYGYSDKRPTWAPDTAVAYITADNQADGHIKARAVCWPERKVYVRVYGDVEQMQRAMTDIGYQQTERALVGARIRRIEDENGNGYVIPYVDKGVQSGGGSLHAKTDASDDKYWRINDEGYGVNTYKGYENKGVTDSIDEDDDDEDDDDEDYTTCEDCGARVHNDDTYSIGYHGDRMVGSCCIDEYTSAIGLRGNEYYVSNDNVTRCETDGNYYDDDYLSENDIHRCESSGDWYHIDDMVSTRDGMVAQDHATELSHEDDDGNQWAPSDEVTTLFNGDVVHNDDASLCHFTRAGYWDKSEHLIVIAGFQTDVELLAHEGYDALLYRVGVGMTSDKYLRVYFGKAITTPSPDLGMSLKTYLSTGKHLSDLRGVDVEGDEVDLDELEDDMRSHWGLDDDEVSDEEVDQIICTMKARAEQQPSLTY